MSLTEPILSPHALSYCSHCECETVIRGTCGNNCCNAGYGRGPDGELGTCPACPGAYDDEVTYRKNPTGIEFLKDTRAQAKRL